MVITAAQAYLRLALDWNDAERAVRRLCPALDGDRLGAITSFVFNLGAGRLAASTLRRKLNAGDWAAARRELVKWVWGGGRKLPGLVLRRAAERELI
jgi:lysozyme